MTISQRVSGCQRIRGWFLSHVCAGPAVGPRGSAVLVALLVLWGQISSAAVIFDNQGETTSGSQVVDSGSVNGWWGQAFSTTALDDVVTEVSLSMLNTDPTTTFSVDIYSSVAGQTLNEPGSLLQSIYSGTPGTFFGPFVIDQLNVPLSPSTEYFMVIAPTVGAVSWSYTAAVSGLNAESVDQGSTWSSDTFQPFQMKVVAVPEPGTITLLAAGLVAGGIAIRRRR